MAYVMHVLILLAVYGVLALSLDLLVGHAGYLSLCHSAFFGIGAYTSGILLTELEIPLSLCLLASSGAGACTSLLLSLPSMRLRGDFFLIATLAFQMIVYSAANNWIALTKGPLGLSIPTSPSIERVHLVTQGTYLLLAMGLLALTLGLVVVVSKGPFGRVLHAIREDESVAQALGKNTLRFKVQLFALSASLASLIGGLYCSYLLFVHPAGFTAAESLAILAMVIIGGAGTRAGPLIGAAAFVLLPELLRFLGLPALIAANVRQMVFGLLLIAIVMYRPSGLASRPTS